MFPNSLLPNLFMEHINFNTNAFTRQLINWYDPSDRQLPWKEEKNPYLVWLSEVLLQQTRVEQGLSYYLRFKEEFPTIIEMAKASEDRIMKLWEGLGYYSRARNMHHTAKYIAFELGGQFPNTIEEIRRLKGVGPYTAAAIASFAFDLPHAVVDGNVYRVLSRVFGIAVPIDTTKGKKIFFDLAQSLIDPKQPGVYNQAIMDFGATVCQPQKPFCKRCPFSDECQAKKENTISLLPRKSKKIKRRERFFHYLVVRYGEQRLIRKRTGKDIWKNLYEFPYFEVPRMGFNQEIIQQNIFWEKVGLKGKVSIDFVSKPFHQLLTHQKIVAVFWEIDALNTPEIEGTDLLLIDKNDLSNFAFPKIIHRYLG